jgi:hydrogenase/urease accessory protein HupE
MSGVTTTGASSTDELRGMWREQQRWWHGAYAVIWGAAVLVTLIDDPGAHGRVLTLALLGVMGLAYLVLGVRHILGGVDHLLFVLALVILVRDWRRVAITVTAFTVAHSITLVAATLDWISVPGQPVEAAIALSIVLIAVEIVNARRGRVSLTVRWPWLVAFCFGLFHGLGFAGALAEVGLPHHAIPIALLFFNLGVEIGQLAIVLALVPFLQSQRGRRWYRSAFTPGAATAIGVSSLAT